MKSNGYFIEDCNIFGNPLSDAFGMMTGGIFHAMLHSDDIPPIILDAIIYTGDAFTVDTGMIINGGTALTVDKYKCDGGTSTTEY